MTSKSLPGAGTALPIVAAVVGFAATPTPLLSQSVTIAPGDSIRFQAGQVFQWREADGTSAGTTVEYPTVTGTLIARGSDSITVLVLDVERTYALGAVRDLRVWGPYGNEGGAVLAGAFVGALVGAAAGGWYCSSDTSNSCVRGGATRGDSEFGAMLGGLGGALAGGIVGVMLAPSEGWAHAELASAAFAPGEGGLLSFRVPVGF